MRILRIRIPEHCFPFDKIKLQNRKYNYGMNNSGLTLVSMAAKLLFPKLLAKSIQCHHSLGSVIGGRSNLHRKPFINYLSVPNFASYSDGTTAC